MRRRPVILWLAAGAVAFAVLATLWASSGQQRGHAPRSPGAGAHQHPLPTRAARRRSVDTAPGRASAGPADRDPGHGPPLVAAAPRHQRGVRAAAEPVARRDRAHAFHRATTASTPASSCRAAATSPSPAPPRARRPACSRRATATTPRAPTCARSSTSSTTPGSSARHLTIVGANPRGQDTDYLHNPYEGQAGVATSRGSDTTISDLDIRSTYGDGIYLGWQARRVLAERNHVSRTGRQGITATDTTDVTIRGNLVDDVTIQTIDIEPNVALARVLVVGNRMWGKGAGINVNGPRLSDVHLTREPLHGPPPGAGRGAPDGRARVRPLHPRAASTATRAAPAPIPASPTSRRSAPTTSTTSPSRGTAPRSACRVLSVSGSCPAILRDNTSSSGRDFVTVLRPEDADGEHRRRPSPPPRSPPTAWTPPPPSRWRTVACSAARRRPSSSRPGPPACVGGSPPPPRSSASCSRTSIPRCAPAPWPRRWRRSCCCVLRPARRCPPPQVTS